MAVYPEKRKGKLTGKWVAEITINGARAGRERFENHTDASRWYDHMKLLGAPPPGSERRKAEDAGPTVGDVFIEAKASHPGWQSGRDVSGSQRAEFVADFFGREKPIAGIDAKAIDRLVLNLKKRPGYSGAARMSPGTINRYLASASTLLRFAQTRGYRKDMPALPWQKEEGKRIHWLTEEAEEAVARWLLDKGWRDSELILRVLIRSGMRWSEFANLSASSVRLSEPVAWINLDKTKTDTPRDIPLDPELAGKLAEFLRARRVPKRNTFAEHLEKGLRAAGQSEDVTVHCLRHTCATRLVLAGMHIAKVQRWMGHSDIKTTMRYTHVAAPDLAEGVNFFTCNAGQSPKPEPNSADIIRLRRA